MNTLYQGDNLEILQSLPDASVDLIATDPPFFTQKDWGAFSDKWTGGLNQYLKFMEQRAIEMHRVLKDTGSLYLHCDPTASHYLKVMLDGVFGTKQFRNEIVWKRHFGKSNNTKKYFSIEHDIILFYTKSDNYIFSPVYTPYSKEYIKKFFRKDEDGRLYTAPFTANDDRRKGKPAKRKYLDESKGVKIDDLWIDNKMLLTSQAKERVGYPTQKPLALYERIIKASSNQGDTVLDPFCGSGTTLDAAQTLGRHWIGIDVGGEAINVIQARLRDRHGLEYDRDYELITLKGR